MAEIRVLSQEVADKIAAGEVAERPSAVVKELVENSIDAGATSIEVEISKGGIERIRICDNGCGIAPDQVETAFLRHATSKLRTIDDLYSIGTMGFRGEALSSICAVAEVEIITRTAENDEGVYVRLEHGRVCQKEPIACAVGTTIVVNKLFENVPARMKFLKKDSTEAGYVADVAGRIALARPDIAFSYTCDGKEVFATSGDGKLKNTVLKLYGIDHAKAVIDVDFEEDNVRVCGVIGKPELSRGNRARQTLLVNGRYIKSHVVSKIVGEAYRNSIMVGKFPFFVLDIGIAPEFVDVNVHPAKTEIKFANENRVYDIIYHAVNGALKGGMSEPKPKLEEKTVEVKPVSAEQYRIPIKTVPKPVSPSFSRPEKVDRELVKEYLDTVIPEQKSEPVKEENGAIFSEFNFLEERQEKPLEVREIDRETVPQTIEEEPVVLELPDIIGQAFDTYILCQSGDEFYMIDQHAAHERFRFENLKKTYYSKEKMSHILLSPMIIKLDYSEAQTVVSNIDVFGRFGFEIEDFGSGSVIVNATPIIADEAAIRDLILEIADALSDSGKHTVADFEERALDMIACKYAIKANKRLNMAEMLDLVEKVWKMELEGIRTCPHGRPIKIEFTKAEIEKMFKRRV